MNCDAFTTLRLSRLTKLFLWGSMFFIILSFIGILALDDVGRIKGIVFVYLISFMFILFYLYAVRRIKANKRIF